MGTTETKSRRNRLVVDLAEDDREWIRQQSEVTGWGSEALVVRMLIRDARQRGVQFAVVAQQPGQPAVPRVEQRIDAFRMRTLPAEEGFQVPEPVEPTVVESMLAGRLEELGGSVTPFVPGDPNGNVLPMIAAPGGAAVSLMPAPKRPAVAYR